MFKKKKNEFIFEEDLEKQNRIDNLFTPMDLVPDSNDEVMCNPFLFDFKSASTTLFSIEDFGLKFKDKNVYLRSIIRNPFLSVKTKKRIFRKYMKKNKKDFLLKINKLEKDKQSSTVDLESITFDRNPKKDLLISLLVIVSFAFIVLLNGFRLFSNYWFEINNHQTIKWIAIGCCFGVVCFIGYFVWFKIIIRNYLNFIKRYNNLTDKTTKVYKRKFKRLYHKTKKYYFKAINNSEKKGYNFFALNLNDLWKSKRSFNGALDLKEKYLNRTNEIKRIKKHHAIIKNIIYGLMICICFCLLVCIIIIIFKEKLIY